MMQYQLDSRFVALKKYVNYACASQESDEIKGNLYRFGTVLICGNIERCVEIITLERLAHRAHPRVLNFVKSHFKRGNNFDCGAIIQLLNRFDPNWAKSFEKFLESNIDVTDGISSLYVVRNSVAHGGAQSVGSQRLTELYEVSQRLINGLVEATK
ncbi:HEPN domain-containing protein [Methylobacterium sp. 174MFSha1.1]|uniref:HEPN domain-containing protein n=1 Tax=Methylobacterium sp. 174MFSha1.1 TaxID=1502749 RepID=UPI001160E134|nr:HEPN domain-containing protein [Methylobacterium sp. 174MFSha1.1]